MGTCVPEICSPQEIRQILSYIPLNISYQGIVEAKFTFPDKKALPPYDGPALCEDRHQKFSTGTVVTLTLCGILAGLCLFGTIFELVLNFLESFCSPSKELVNLPVYHNKAASDIEAKGTEHGHESDDDELNSQSHTDSSEKTYLVEKRILEKLKNHLSWYMCFSIIKNTKAILNTDTPSGAILSINGIRTISMTWVILGHIYSVGVMAGGLVNFTELVKVLNRFSFLSIANAFFSVDSFFLLSGLLVSYLGMRRLDAKGKLPIWKFYLHRYIRLTPTYGFVILIFVFVYPWMGKGPLWSTVSAKHIADPCKDKWWTNLLYINNFYPNKLGEECLGWGWYLANDMQFFLISPFILYMSYWFKWIGSLASNGALILISIIVTGALIGHYKLQSLQVVANLARPQPAASFEDLVYIKPYCRIIPYLAGMLLGYLLFRKVQIKGQLKPLFAVIGWAVAIGCGMAVVYGTWDTTKKGGKPFTEAENILYGSLSRLTWSVALSWVIFACHTGVGGLVNSILSWRAFIPLSRLTFGAYLLHPLVMIIFYQTKQSPRAYTDMDMAFQFVAITAFSYASAFILALGVEYPTLNLEKKIFGQ
eukprot:gene1737-16222_t